MSSNKLRPPCTKHCPNRKIGCRKECTEFQAYDISRVIGCEIYNKIEDQVHAGENYFYLKAIRRKRTK